MEKRAIGTALLSAVTLIVGYLLPVTFPSLTNWKLGAAWAVTAALFLLGLRLVWRKKTAPEPPHTLREHFERDFGLLNLRQDNVEAVINGVAAPFSVQLNMDFNGGSDFLSIYIPQSTVSFEAAKLIAVEAKSLRNRLVSDVDIKLRQPGVHVEAHNRKMVFTGKVHLYHENYFTPRQIADLMDAYETAGLQLDARGQTYATVKWLNAKAFPA